MESESQLPTMWAWSKEGKSLTQRIFSVYSADFVSEMIMEILIPNHLAPLCLLSTLELEGKSLYLFYNDYNTLYPWLVNVKLYLWCVNICGKSMF